MECAALVEPDFMVNVVPNLDGDICGIFTGNWASAWRNAIMLTRPENAALARKAGLVPAGSIAEALENAYRMCGSKKPSIAVMPQGANTLPFLTP